MGCPLRCAVPGRVLLGRREAEGMADFGGGRSLNGVSVITPTGGRHEAFSLLARWVSRQTYHGPLQWLCVDDCQPLTACPDGATMIRPPVLWEPGWNTQARNLLAALPHVQYDRIAILEDDDYIAPGYLETLVARLDQAPLIGEQRARYYHVGTREYYVHSNLKHSSLGQTGFRAELLPLFEDVLKGACKFLDIELFRRHHGALFPPSGLHVGMKGMPGRPGIGVGHRPAHNWANDRDLTTLGLWIGEDTEYYRPFASWIRGSSTAA